jgi:catechol 2,3-dioxygenase-like lactoylglutathione lyase family enzyme
MVGKSTKGRVTKLAPILVVDDIDRSIDFYCEKLGFSLEVRVPEEAPAKFAIIKSGSVEVMLQSKVSITEDFPKVPAGKRAGRAVLYLDVKGIEELYGVLKEETGVAKEIHNAPHGQREFYVHDPDGNFIGFAE